MKRQRDSITFFLLVLSLACAPAPTEPPTPPTPTPEPATDGFSVVGGRILDPQGIDWVSKGTNIFPDQWNQGDSLDCWGFNALRVNHFPDDGWYVAEAIDNTIEAYAGDRGKVVILDLAHESATEGSGIGSYWDGRWGELASLYTQYALRYKDNPYVWIEAPNEPGTNGALDAASWVGMNQAIIKAVRDTGNTQPILVSGWCWGQDACGWGSEDVADTDSAILSLGDQLLTIDGVPQENIIFTHHVYDQWKYDEDGSKLRDYYERVIAQGKAMIVGEYGSANGETNTEVISGRMLGLSQEFGLGRMVWTWTANDANDLTTTGDGSGYLIDDCDNPTNLTTLGQLVWGDVHTL